MPSSCKQSERQGARIQLRGVDLLTLTSALVQCTYHIG